MIGFPLEEPNPIEAVLARDWGAVGGWGLFFTIAMFIIIGSFREWWVPGPRYRRTESLLEKTVDQNKLLTDQNDKLITANEITKHFFEETTPTRSSLRNTGDDQGGVPS